MAKEQEVSADSETTHRIHRLADVLKIARVRMQG